MRRVRWGGLDAVVAGGPDREGGGEGPVVVLLHGFGAPGDDLVGLWRVLDVPPEVRFVFPAAPLALDMGWGDARAWWMIDLVKLELALAAGEARDLAGEAPEGLPAARAQVLALLDEMERELAPPPGQIVLGGFSQGAMLSCDVALRTDRRLAGLALLSGTLLAASEWIPLMPARRGLPVFQSHGTRDPLLPFGAAVRLRDHLKDAGLAVEWIEFLGAHEIPSRVVEGLGAFFTRLLEPHGV